MSLNIVVCIKQGPSPEHLSKVTLDPEKGTIQREGIPAVVNPLDRHALEEGLRIRERFSGRVTAISMGPPQAREVLEEALAVGIDDVVLLCDRAFAGADTLATACSLAGAIRRLGEYDLVLCGNETLDGATGQVGPQLAELLDIPHVTCVNEITFVDEKALRVKRAIEQGHLNIELRPPALLSVTRDINRPRLPTVFGIMEAAGREIKTWCLEDIEAERETVGLAGSPTQVRGAFKHEVKRMREILEGPPEELVPGLVVRTGLDVDNPEPGFWVPAAALTRGDRGLWSVLAVVSSQDPSETTVNRRDVEWLHSEGERVFVRGTLTAGDQIIAGGIHRLVAGQRVEVVASHSTTSERSNSLAVN